MFNLFPSLLKCYQIAIIFTQNISNNVAKVIMKLNNRLNTPIHEFILYTTTDESKCLGDLQEV